MVQNRKPDPLAHPIKARDLRKGMATFTRVVDHDGNVKFKLDIPEIKEVGACTAQPNGIHVAYKDGMIACYWGEATVWVKELNRD